MWPVDTVRSELKFSVGHLGLHTVHGTLAVRGRIVVAEDPLDSSVTATIDLGSVRTGSKGRDSAILSAHLVDVDKHPTATYRSTGIAAGLGPGEYLMSGELTFLDVTRQVPLRIRLERFAPGDGRPRPIVTGRAEFLRRDFGFVYQVRPKFLDRAISQTVTVDIRLEGSPTASSEGTGH
ncbi:YceI family protein [Mycolicibacterium monacense]|nr:YceI family protein [Mycolicibacterium monacense]